jgi:hypothetical protein
MRIRLSLRAARACAAAALVVCLGLSPSFAHMGAGPGPAARPGPGFGPSPRFAPRGFNQRFEAGRSGFNRFGLNRFDRFGFDHFNRYGGNQLFGGWGWGGEFPAAASEPDLVGGGAPVIINIRVDPDPGDAGALSGCCVIHKLNYDSNGKYVDERQIPQC